MKIRSKQTVVVSRSGLPRSRPPGYRTSNFERFRPDPVPSKQDLRSSCGRKTPTIPRPVSISKSRLKKQPSAEHSQSHSGLRNLGNTCFMNSVLQCLIHTTPLQNFFSDPKQLLKNRNLDSKIRGQLAFSFHQLILDCKKSNNPVSPTEIKHLMGKFYPQFKGYSQQDAAEFLRSFLEGLHQDLNRITGKPNYREMTGNIKLGLTKVANQWWDYALSRDNSVITDVFQGQLLSVTTCRNCHSQQVSCDTFWDLSLPVTRKSMSLQSCFELFTTTSKVPSYRCENCKKEVECLLNVSLYRYPSVLVLQLKRFSVSGYRREKLNTEIQVPEEISLERFGPQAKGEGRYKLYGVCHHIGSLGFGHYVADVKGSEDWTCFNDQRVSPARVRLASDTAYVLFYKKVQLIQRWVKDLGEMAVDINVEK